MTRAARQHLQAVVAMLNKHKAQLLYPPGDRRTSFDASTWALSEQQAANLLGRGGRMQMDCSQTGAWLLKCVGCWHWTQPGYTGSHLQTIRPTYTDARQAGVGALVIFGPGTGHHEAVVYNADPRGGDPLLASHGRPGFDLVRLSAMRAEQTASGHPGVRFCSVAAL